MKNKQRASKLELQEMKDQEGYFNFKNVVSENTPESKQRTMAETNVNFRYGTS